MNFDLQNLIALALVAIAAAYVVRAGWSACMARKQSACGGCPTCPSSADKTTSEVFSIQPRGGQRP